jgi:hypothetical protein
MYRGFLSSLNEKNYVSTAANARSLFEEVAHFHYFLTKTEVTYSKIIRLWDIAKPRRKLDRNWQISLISSIDELNKRLEKAIMGSDYDWNEWFRRAFSEREHADLPNAKEIYALLCDMVHPNY